LLLEAEALVHDLEARLSRFRPDSALSRLNRERAATCPTLAAVTPLALGLRDRTGGAFDPTLGAGLCALGYDRSFARVSFADCSSPPDAVTADALATAIIVAPNAIIGRLAAFSAHALVHTREGRWWSSPATRFTEASP